MVEVPVTIACGNYDRTEAIRDGRVKVEGCAVTYLPLYPEEIFHRVFKFQEYQGVAFESGIIRSHKFELHAFRKPFPLGLVSIA